MSVGYQAVQWSPHKRRYDAVLAIGVVGYLVAFVGVSSLLLRGDHAISPPILLLRALGSCAFILLNLILCIGPLARLEPRLHFLLYNRRHLGVTTFLIALLHALLVTGFYHGFAVLSPPLSLLVSNTQYRFLSAFPFEILGVLALIILFLMAATSHDFWLKNLSPGVWKALHMLVYPAWVLLLLHIALGSLQTEKHRGYVVLVVFAFVLVTSLHLITGRREISADGASNQAANNAQSSEANGTWIHAGTVDQFENHRAKVVCLAGKERVAIFRNGDQLSAISNVCAHQMGPLGEGRIIDGCVTCPWHGYQYQAQNGQSPPPFSEKIPTYQLRITGCDVHLNVNALPAGTPVEPVKITGENR